MYSKQLPARIFLFTTLAHIVVVAGVVTMSNLSQDRIADNDSGPLYIEFFTFSPPPEEPKMLTDDLDVEDTLDSADTLKPLPKEDIAIVDLGLASMTAKEADERDVAASEEAVSVGQQVESLGRSSATSYWDTVRQQIAQHLRYPVSMRRRHVEDRVILRVAIGTNGELRSVSSLPPYGDPTLTRAATRAVHRAQPFPAPEQMDDVTAEIPIRFDLSD